MIRVIIPADEAGQPLTDVLSRQGYAVPAPCGRRGVCGKCRVRILAGRVLSRKDGAPLLPDENGFVLACQSVCSGETTVVELSAMDGDGLSLTAEGSTTTDRFGFALDIGTTTLAAVKVNLADGTVTASASCLNPQQAFGADVISRICACGAGHLTDLQSAVITAVRGLLCRLDPLMDSPSHDGRTDGALPPLTVAGNTTMLHLFAGISPESMGHSPFTPAFTDTKILTGNALGLPVGTVTLLPSVSAFVGGDITAGMLTCSIGHSQTPVFLLDIGTNGEMVLDTGCANGERTLLAASTAAGPALEGANISCGMGGVAGAVCAVRRENGTLVYQTVGDASPLGLCGSGLVDFTASLLEGEQIDESGYLESEDNEGVMLIARRRTQAQTETTASDVPHVTLTQKDVREIQLAKSAIRAGIEALLDEAGMTPEAFIAAGGMVCLAGGLGYYMNPQSAVRIGLLPPAFVQRLTAAGNTALKGAVTALCDPAAVDEMRRLTQSCRVIDLEKSDVFNDGFIEYMMFPETEE